MDYLCSICQKPIRGIFRGDLICHSCYKTWQEAIESKESWVILCINEERKRRYQEQKWFKRNPPIYFESLEAYVEKVGREI